MTARRIILLILIASTLASFVSIVSNRFVLLDDPDTISSNPHLNPPDIEGIVYYWKHPAAGLYIPITYSFWGILASIAWREDATPALNPAVYHAASVLLHLLSVLLVYKILRRIIRSESLWPACLGALLFAVHPLQVETVAWASGAKDLLAGLFSLLSIQQYLRARDEPARSGASWIIHYSIACAALVLGMLAKPSAVVAPLIAGWLDLLILHRNWLSVLRWIAPMILLIIPCVIWARAVQSIWPETITPLWWRPFVAADAITFYLYKLVWPVWLTSFYGRTPSAVIESGLYRYTSLVPPLVLVLLLFNRIRRVEVIAGAGIFLLALLPVLGFTPFMFQLYSTVADHYMYIPMLGVALIVGELIAAVPRRTGYAIGSIVLLALAVRSVLQERHWRDSIALFSHAAAYDPSNVQVQSGLGRSLALAGRVPEAIPHFAEVVRAVPDRAESHTDLAMALLAVGRLNDALEQFTIANRLSPNDPVIAAQRDALRRQLASPATTQ